MTVAGIIHSAYKTDEPPGSDLGRLTVTLNPAIGYEDRASTSLFLHTECRNARGMPMNRQYRRSRPEGRHHRTMIRVLLLPKLGVGDAVPSGTWLGHWLRINPSEAFRHMQRVLIEDGIVVETRGKGPARRRYIVACSNNQWGEAA